MTPDLVTFQRDPDGTVTFKLEGTFDAPAATLLKQALEQVDASRVVVDFSRVRHFVDVAVAVLTHSLQRRAIELRGLGEHQASVFRYFGIAVGMKAKRYSYRPEEVLAL